MKRFILLALLVMAVVPAAFAQQPPRVMDVQPEQNQVGVPEYQSIYLFFNTYINATSLNSSTFIVYGSITGYHTGSISYSGPYMRATFNPDVAFAQGEVVTVTATTGIIGITGYPMSQSFTSNFIVGGDGGSGYFGPAQPISRADSKPEGIRAVDLDGDADIDLVTRRVSPDQYIITTWDNDGNGSFSGTNRQTNDSYDAITDLLPVDIDWDGGMDFLVEFLDWSDYQSFSLAALFPPFGTTIYPSNLVDATGATSGYATADFDGDGDQDILQTYYSGAGNLVRMYANNGSGIFSTITWEQSTGLRQTSACAVDFNNDGKIDFATISDLNDLVDIWLNQGGMSFTLSQSRSIGTIPTGIHAADLNGDRAADLVTVNRDTDDVSVLFNNGEGFFGAAVDHVVGEYPNSLTMGDLDGDGDLDVATANKTACTVSVLLNDGTGDFGNSRIDYASGNTNRPPGHIAAGDFDGDGDIELATSNGGYYSNYIYVMFNQPQPLVIGVTPGRNQLDVVPASDIAVMFNVDMNATTINSSSFMVAGRSSGPLTGPISYNGSTRTATFAPEEELAPGDLVTVILTSGIQSAEGVPIKPDVWSFTVAAGDGSGSFGIDVEYPVGTMPRSLFASDLDGDLGLDLISVNRNTNNLSVLMGQGDGSFAPQSALAVGTTPVSVWAGDLDGDGDVDLASANSDDDDVSILLNNGNGTYSSHVDYPVANYPVWIEGGDLDGDGDTDLVTGNLGGVSVLLNAGDGTFAIHVDYMTGSAMNRVFLLDYDGDGDLDLAGANINQDLVTLMKNHGDGALVFDQTRPTGVNPNCVLGADLDGDGDLDLAVSDRSDNTVSIIKNNGNGTFAGRVSYAVGTGPVEICAADVDGDGDLDLATANYNSDDVTVLLNGGTGAFTTAGVFGGGNGPFGIFAGDFNGDRSLDLAVSNLLGNTVSVLLNLEADFVVLPVPVVGVDIPFVSGADTLAILNFSSETLDNVAIRAHRDEVPPGVPAGTNWVRRHYEITPYPADASFEVNLTLFYDQAEFDESGLPIEGDLHLYRYDEGALSWEDLQGTVDVARNSVSCPGVTQFSTWGFSGPLGLVPAIPDLVPIVTTLHQNYPNPFNPETEIRYSLEKEAVVSLIIYDVLGREVALLVNGKQAAGNRSVSWNGRDRSGHKVASGLYFYRLETGEYSQTKRMVLVK